MENFSHRNFTWAKTWKLYGDPSRSMLIPLGIPHGIPWSLYGVFVCFCPRGSLKYRIAVCIWVLYTILWYTM